VTATTTRRGYGWRHQKLRARWAPIVAAGGVHCARGEQCLRRDQPGGTLIVPGEPWDLGHDDLDRSIYTGPEHQRCNRATAGRRRRRTSRKW
jgi:hypothetical protein